MGRRSVEAGGQGRGLSRRGCGRMAGVFGGGGGDFDVNRRGAGLGDGVDGDVDIFEMLGLGGVTVGSDLAGKFPVVRALGHRFAAFAFHVFAHVMLDGFHDPGRGVIGGAEGKGFFHTAGADIKWAAGAS